MEAPRAVSPEITLVITDKVYCNTAKLNQLMFVIIVVMLSYYVLHGEPRDVCRSISMCGL